MKLRSASVDDLHNELCFLLEADGRRRAKFVLWCFRRLNWFHRGSMLATLRLNWRKSQFDDPDELDTPGAFGYPPIGHEFFNVPPDELERAWER